MALSWANARRKPVTGAARRRNNPAWSAGLSVKVFAFLPREPQVCGMRVWLPFMVAGLLICPLRGEQAGRVGLIRIDGTIGPATADYIARATRVAGDERARCLIVVMDTPGGLLESTKEIVQTFYASPVPVVVYVSPSGASAGSAGCFLTLAADVAAMAPNTNIGAAHPVSLGGIGEDKPDEVMAKKLESFSASYIESIAAKRHRNVEWARSAVRDSASITAEKALELNVVEIVAKDVPDLLRQLDGREVNGKPLATAGSETFTIAMLPRERVFQVLWRPEVMFVLMLIAIYGIIGELGNPGAILPGIAGAMAVVLFLYMSSVLPVSAAGVALVLLAVGLFIIDVFAPTHGLLTFGGVVSFFLGSMLLFNHQGPEFRLSLAMIIPATVITAAFFLFIVGAGLRAQRLPVRAGRETLMGRIAPALTAIGAKQGKIFVEGEYWNAVSESPVAEGQPVEVIGIDGLTLKVKPRN